MPRALSLFSFLLCLFALHSARAYTAPFEEAELGYWMDSGKVLVAVKLDNEYYLMQRSVNGSYYVSRGRNLLYSGSTVLNTTFDLSLIVSDETDVGGLYAPDNFPAATFAAFGYSRNTDGEWIPHNPPGNGGNDNGDDGDNGGETSPQPGLPAGTFKKIDLGVVAETQDDTVDLSEYRADYDYSKFVANYGFGSPYYRGEAAAPIEQIAAGWSHVNSGQLYPESILPGEQVGTFAFFQYFEGGNLFSSARAILPQYPGAQYVLDQNWEAAITDIPMLRALAPHIAGMMAVADAAALDHYRSTGYMMLDEEEIDRFSKLQFALMLLAEVSKIVPEKYVVYYGYPVLDVFWGGRHWYDRADENKLNDWKNEPLFHTPYIMSSRLYFDANSGYVKSPLPVSSSLYKRDVNGDYILQNGKRQLRDDNFSEYQFGIKNTWLAQPNNLLPDDQRSGHWNPSTGEWIHDVLWSVTNPYYMLTKWQLVSIANANANGHGYDITRYRDLPNKQIAIQSLLTEPWTYGGNSSYRRWIGEEQIKFILMAPLMMGFAGVELWENGWLTERFHNPDYPGRGWGANVPVPYKGSPLYPHWGYEGAPGGDPDNPVAASDNFSRFKWATKAVSEMRKVYDHYALGSTLRYVHFTRYGTAVADREVILMGLYQGENMHLLAWYPWHDPQDVTTVTVRVGGHHYPLTITGREVVLYRLGIEGAPEPHEITAEYHTIDGVHTIVTGDLERHRDVPVETYANWSDAHGGLLPHNDDDGDGATNLIEYAFGMNPAVPDSALQPQMTIVDGFPQMTFRRNLPAADITYTVETTTDLVPTGGSTPVWAPIARIQSHAAPEPLPAAEGIVVITSGGTSPSEPDIQRIQVKSIAQEKKRFFRVKVETN